MENKNVILDKSFEFALLVIEYAELLELQKKFVVSRQLLRSGTSIGANIREAQSCESRADFVHKLKIAAKEACETEYWLLLCKNSKSYPWNELLLPLLNEIQKLLSSIITSAKKNN
jgi:four helix bundle protein